MAKEKNKNMYRPIKNANMIGEGKKESVAEILNRGSQAKPDNVSHVQHEEAKTKARPNIEAKVAEQKKQQAEVTKQSKEQMKGKEKQHDKDR